MYKLLFAKFITNVVSLHLLFNIGSFLLSMLLKTIEILLLSKLLLTALLEMLVIKMMSMLILKSLEFVSMLYHQIQYLGSLLQQYLLQYLD